MFAGVYTGSIYYDVDLAVRGFPGEKVTNGSVLVVKTHSRPNRRFHFIKAVLLFRDMSDAGVAENNRRRGGHTGEARASAYKDQRE